MPAAPPVAATPAVAAAAAAATQPEPSPGRPAAIAADDRASRPAATDGSSSSSSKSSSNDAAAPQPSEPEGKQRGPAAAGSASTSVRAKLAHSGCPFSSSIRPLCPRASMQAHDGDVPCALCDCFLEVLERTAFVELPRQPCGQAIPGPAAAQPSCLITLLRCRPVGL